MPSDEAHAYGERRAGAADEAWRDPSLSVDERVVDLIAAMTLEEKVAQLYGAWVGVDPASQDVAPQQHEFADADLHFADLIRFGLGQLTRPFGTSATDAVDGAKTLARLQQDVVNASRFGIPALAHEECLSGFMTKGATIYPTPLAWGAAWDPELVRDMALQIGRAMRAVGVHQGLAPVLDVSRDVRWGRTEETIGEDPYLVGTIGTAYVVGLQSAGVVATLKHFVGYSASTGARNFGPVSAGPRELADVLLPPFEMAVRDGGACSVMASYTEVDGVPTTADRRLLTERLREVWGFDGTTVSDYFAVSFLELQHRIAASPTEAAVRAIDAGVDVELPAVRCYGEPLIGAVRDGTVDESTVDAAVTRVLRQKVALGLLDPDWTALPPALRESGDEPVVDLDPPHARDLARRLAEESVVLLGNGGTLPLTSPGRIAVVGPTAHDPRAMFGCYAFPNHAEHESQSSDLGVYVPTVLDAVRAEFPGSTIVHQPGCAVSGTDVSGIAQAVQAAEQADVCLAIVGDRSGLFGRGTSGEGCDADDLRLPGVQSELVDALLDTGTPVVLVLLSGRPYALGPYAGRVAAVVQAFFPGEEGGHAVAGVLSGRVCPSGRLPVSVPAAPSGRPSTYLTPPLGRQTNVSTVDPSPVFAFGHGLSYTTFDWKDAMVGGRLVETDSAPVTMATDGEVEVSLVVANTGDRKGAEVVQLYLHDPVAQTTRPVRRLIGYARVFLEPGQHRRVTFRVHADLTSFTGLAGDRVVEPGDIELSLSRSSEHHEQVIRLTLEGAERTVDHTRHLTTPVEIA